MTYTREITVGCLSKAQGGHKSPRTKRGRGQTEFDRFQERCTTQGSLGLEERLSQLGTANLLEFSPPVKVEDVRIRKTPIDLKTLE